MAEHDVTVKTPPLEVGKVDVIFRVKRDGLAHGRLKVSRGGVEWMQRSDIKKAFHMDWNKFDQVFSAHGDKGRTRSARRKQ